MAGTGLFIGIVFLLVVVGRHGTLIPADDLLHLRVEHLRWMILKEAEPKVPYIWERAVLVIDQCPEYRC